MSFLFILFLNFNINAQASLAPTPNVQITYGELCTEDNPDYVNRRYPERIIYCHRHLDDSRKAKIYDTYGVPEKCRHQYTIDHFIPLALGGDNANANLWPEHKKVKATRPTLEDDLYYALKNGEITQADAIAKIRYAKTHAPVVEISCPP
jgi:hypothetical protein